MRRARLQWAAVVGALGFLGSPVTAAVEYTSQNSTTTGLHSWIVTTTGKIKDTQFANLIDIGTNNGLNYNEIAFDFNECFGGGMIDELMDLPLIGAGYTSASAYNQVAYGTIINGKYQSAYNVPFMASVAAKKTVMNAASDGHDKDIFGPNGFKKENPQYTPSGSGGAGITLAGNNANKMTQSNNYLAVLFAGNDIKPSTINPLGDIDYNSLITTYNTLIGIGYKAANIYVLYPFTKGQPVIPNSGGQVLKLGASTIANATSANLESAVTNWIFNNTTPTTQIFYWNGLQHGAKSKEAVNGPVQRKTAISLDLDTTFVSDVQQNYSVNTSLGDFAPLDLPYIDVESPTALVSPLQLTFNGDLLSPLQSGDDTDVFGDGSVFDYEYALSAADIAGIGLSNTISVDSSDSDPLNLAIDLMVTDLDTSVTVPEPGMGMIVLVALGWGIRRGRGSRPIRQSV